MRSGRGRGVLPVSATRDVVAILDADGTLPFWQLKLPCSGTRPKMIGTRCFDYIHPDDLEEVFLALTRRWRQRVLAPMEFRASCRRHVAAP